MSTFILLYFSFWKGWKGYKEKIEKEKIKKNTVRVLVKTAKPFQ